MSFDGFPKRTVEFLAGLRDHNNKKWFDGHRRDYEDAFLAPAVAFSEALAPQLRKIEPEICVEPRVNGSIMRINRDIRFSKDKSPYKDHLDLWFWTGDRKGWESSGFFFRLTRAPRCSAMVGSTRGGRVSTLPSYAARRSWSSL